MKNECLKGKALHLQDGKVLEIYCTTWIHLTQSSWTVNNDRKFNLFFTIIKKIYNTFAIKIAIAIQQSKASMHFKNTYNNHQDYFFKIHPGRVVWSIFLRYLKESCGLVFFYVIPSQFYQNFVGDALDIHQKHPQLLL